MFSEDFQEVLLFMSRNMRPLLVHIGRYLIMAFVTILVLVPGFFLSLTLSRSVWGYVVLTLLAAVSHWMVRRIVVFPSLFHLDRLFLNFLRNHEETSVPVSNRQLKEALRRLRQDWSGPFLFRFSRGIQATILALRVEEAVAPSWPEGKHRSALRSISRYFYIGYLISGLFLFIFLGISFLSTLGLDAALKLLIFTLGTVFALFLFQAVIEPIVYLLAVRRMYLRRDSL